MNEKKLLAKANTLSILSANCLNMRTPLADCHICETVCPQNALSFHDEKWNAVNCTLCGVCAMVCPTQVFQIDMPYLLQQSTETLTFTCAQNPAVPTDALRINCLQQLNPLHVMHLLYRYTSVTIYLPAAQCKQCTHQWYAQGFLQQISSYQIAPEKLQIITTEYTPTETENDRRELFRNLFHHTEDSAKKVVSQTIKKISAEFSSQEIEQTIPTVFPSRLPLYALYVKKQLSPASEAELPFRILQCTNCTFCGACTHICPTQAIIIENTEKHKHLLFHPELCINCNLCKEICMQRGLNWGDFLTVEQFVQSPIPLANSIEYICSKCEHTFYQWPTLQANEASVCIFCK